VVLCFIEFDLVIYGAGRVDDLFILSLKLFDFFLKCGSFLSHFFDFLALIIDIIVEIFGDFEISDNKDFLTVLLEDLGRRH